MSRAKSSAPRMAPSGVTLKPSWLEWGLFVLIVLPFARLVTSTGLRRAMELMPWPDGLEYSAAALNLTKGRGPVLHFGGYTYPSRYTAGYPLLLEFFSRLFSRQAPLLWVPTFVIAEITLLVVFYLARMWTGRAAGLIAALMLVLSPIFITYSMLVMSDVPTLFITTLAAVALLSATEEAPTRSKATRTRDWGMFGLLAGFSTIMRPTNGVILVGLVVCVLMVPFERRELASLLGAGIAVAIGFAIPVAWQLHQNAINLGSPFASGYSWWVPEVYGAGGKTFSAAYLFGPTMPRNPYGNLLVYVTTLLGLDGFIGHRASPGYFLYPFAAAVFAMVGFVAILRDPEKPAVRRLMWFGLGYLGALTALYCFYIFTDVAFILPGAFILFVAAGAGVAIANRWMRDVMRDQNRRGCRLAVAAGVIVLDVLLVISLATEAVSRLSARPQDPLMVESLQSLDSSMSWDVTIVSNISLQFLDLYLGETRSYVGLNSLDPGERFTDYHLHRLYEKRAAGWSGPVPAVVFDGEQMSSAAADSLAAAIDGKRPVFLVIAAPESQQYADVLKDELDQLQGKFAIEPVSQNEAIAVYRLTARK
ncbi:MAG TPA: glycosyltransferase family 39 protein [Candidatus Binatus sp.]|uniref:ArnT family glycosyltransferase n=1 Tax=Candidatus Binatus sp. TaxID=2811406 RepID=UPI002F3FD505